MKQLLKISNQYITLDFCFRKHLRLKEYDDLRKKTDQVHNLVEIVKSLKVISLNEHRYPNQFIIGTPQPYFITKIMNLTLVQGE